MKLCLFGATGPVGRAVLDRAAAGGHDVVAVTRRPEGFGSAVERVRVVRADIHSPAEVAAVLTGADAVISTVGVNPRLGRVTTYSEGARNILDAMASTGVRRIVCVSSKELEQGSLHDEPLLYRFAFAHLLSLINRSIYDDMRRMEQLLRDSDADWTVVRPAGLFAADRVTDYRVTTGHEPGVSTSVADLADLLVAQATAVDSHVGEVVTVLTDDGAPPYLRLLVGQRALHQH